VSQLLCRQSLSADCNGAIHLSGRLTVAAAAAAAAAVTSQPFVTHSILRASSLRFKKENLKFKKNLNLKENLKRIQG